MNVICFGNSNIYGYDPRGYSGGRYGVDNVLSQIILDNASTAEQISRDVWDRFITGSRTLFRDYLFNEEQ